MLFTQFEGHYIKYNASKGMDWANGKRLARGAAYRDIRRCLEVFFIYDMLHEYLWDANELMSKDIACNDFEDNLQLICSFRSDVDIIVTDNVRDFACSGMFGITVLTPSQLLTHILYHFAEQIENHPLEGFSPIHLCRWYTPCCILITRV